MTSISFPENDTRTINLFTIKEGISESILALINQIALPHYRWVEDVSQADYLVFPTNYEVGHELTDFYLRYFKAVPRDRELALQYETELIRLSALYDKKIIVFYFSDQADRIPIENTIVFRTSIQKSKAGPNEHVMPPFKHDLSKVNTEFPQFLTWNKKPAVGFRGQATPFRLKGKSAITNQLNLICNRMGIAPVFPTKTNFGYLHRRNALLFLSRNPSIHCDFTLTGEQDIENADSIRLFRNNLFSNPYNVCVSGFGNYSYRFYEAVSCGRIPVFVNTDCKLPFEEFIPWKDYVVWVEENEIHRIGDKLLDFHRQKKGEAFIIISRNSKESGWNTFLRKVFWFD